MFIGVVSALLFVGCSSGQGTEDANANNEQNDETDKAELSVSKEETNDEVKLNPL